MDDVKNSYAELSEKLSNRVCQLEDRQVDTDRKLNVLRASTNEMDGIVKSHLTHIRKSIDTVLFPAIVDIGKAVAASSRSQVLKNEIEGICNNAKKALNDLDKETLIVVNGILNHPFRLVVDNW